MNNRVKELRKYLHLTQTEFSEKIGITNSALSRIESGINVLTDQNTKSIIREFGVSEIWLRTGEGEMFPPKTRAEELAAFFHTLDGSPPDSIKVRLVQVLAQLDEPEWELIARMAEKLAKTEKDPDGQ